MTTSNWSLLRTGAAFFALAVAAACGSSDDSGGSGVRLGSAANYAILAKTGITNTGTSDITGNIAVSPIGYEAIVGFALTPAVPDAATVSSTSDQVSGHVFAANYHGSTPTNLTAAIGDMEDAYTSAAGRAAGHTELGGGEIGGMTLAPGVYKWGTGVGITTDVTLSGSSTDVWIFQIAQNLTVASAADVILAGGARPQNIFWQVGGAVTLGTTAHLEGIVLCQTAITLDTGASVDGRLLAQTAVTLDGNVIVEP